MITQKSNDFYNMIAGEEVEINVRVCKEMSRVLCDVSQNYIYIYIYIWGRKMRIIRYIMLEHINRVFILDIGTRKGGRNNKAREYKERTYTKVTKKLIIIRTIENSYYNNNYSMNLRRNLL